MMKGLRSIVPLSRESLRGIEQSPIIGHPPVIEWINPRELYIEESYQRDVGENGTALIRKIVKEFSWHKFKTPIGFRAPEFDGVIVVVDGQHTSIASATRGIERIPVAVYENATEAERAAGPSSSPLERESSGHKVRRIDKPKAEPVKSPPPAVNRSAPVVKDPPPPAPMSNYHPPEPPKPIYLTQANGILVTIDGLVTRGDDQSSVSRDGAKLVARLVSVMPAQISFERLSQHVFSGRPSARLLLDDLVEEIRRPLARVGLEIYRVERSGYMIRSVGKSGENLLTA